jgi:hypothetical protein
MKKRRLNLAGSTDEGTNPVCAALPWKAVHAEAPASLASGVRLVLDLMVKVYGTCQGEP